MSTANSYVEQQQCRQSFSSRQQPKSRVSWVYVNGESEQNSGKKRSQGSSALWNAFITEHNEESSMVQNPPTFTREAAHVASSGPPSTLLAKQPLYDSPLPVQNQTPITGNVLLPQSTSALTSQNPFLSLTPGILRQLVAQSYQPHILQQIQARLSTMINSSNTQQYQTYSQLSETLMKQSHQKYNLQLAPAIIGNNGAVNKIKNPSPLTSNASHKIDQASRHDVLFDKGDDVQYHIGNITFREHVMSYAMIYVTCENQEKFTYCKLIYDEIINFNPPGRFLKRDRKTRKWFEISKKDTLERIGESLQESGLNIKKKLDRAKAMQKLARIQKKEDEKIISSPHPGNIMQIQQEEEDEKRIEIYTRKRQAEATNKNADNYKNTNSATPEHNYNGGKKSKNTSKSQVEIAAKYTSNFASNPTFDEEKKGENVTKRQAMVDEKNAQFNHNKRGRQLWENKEEVGKKNTNIVALQSNDHNLLLDGATDGVGNNIHMTRPGTAYPHSHDVLNGRDKYAQYHLGNIFFRDIIKKDLAAYGICKRKEKKIFCEKVYHKIIFRYPPGRFLTWNTNENIWIPISKDKALRKIGQALRDERKTRKMWNRNELSMKPPSHVER